MSFTVDKQTLEDLNLLGKFKKNSIINLFDQTCTRKGELLLESMFRNPLQHVDDINMRSSVIRYFQEAGVTFPIANELFGDVEFYLNSPGASSAFGLQLNTLTYKVKQMFVSDKGYEKIQLGIIALIKLLNSLYKFVQTLPAGDSPYKEQINELKSIYEDSRLSWLKTAAGINSLSFSKTVKYDSVFRHTCREKLSKLLNTLYEMDVYISVANVARARKFAYATALPKERNYTSIKEVYHPSLKSPVANTITIDKEKNVFFLTGANMAGKSTLMKAYSIAVYLAHMGFPVAAEAMEFSILDGMYTSINVPDNISMGYSHFYAEVLRVKNIAEEVGKSKNLLVIFDELFKGTNVKDAYDATVAVTEAFAEYHNCSFIISTHIIEVGEELQKRCDNIQYYYVPTEMDGTRPVYTYRLKPGITEDRHGMMIVNNEQIIEIIKNEIDYSGID